MVEKTILEHGRRCALVPCKGHALDFIMPSSAWTATCRNEEAAALDVTLPMKDEDEDKEVQDVIGTASTLILNSLDAEMSTDGEEKQSSPLVALGALLGGILLLAGGG